MIQAFDHAAIPIDAVGKMLNFYRGLGCQISNENEGLVHAVQFGDNKINFHTTSKWRSEGFTLRGSQAFPGCGDFCFVWGGTLESLFELLSTLGAPIEEGPVCRVGGRDGGTAMGMSVFTRDPDSNLLEFIIYQ